MKYTATRHVLMANRIGKAIEDDRRAAKITKFIAAVRRYDEYNRAACDELAKGSDE